MITIGRLENINIGCLHTQNLIAKIDTGAYNCSIGCEIQSVVGNCVTFRVNDKEYSYPIVRTKIVKNANSSSLRYFIELEAKLGGENGVYLFSLSDRSCLKHPVLIGRRFLSGKFLVDVSRTFMLGK